MFGSFYIFTLKGLLFTFDDLNGSLVNVKEAIEDLPNQDSPHVKKLRRMFERTSPISGCGLFGVERYIYIINKSFIFNYSKSFFEGPH